MTYAQHRRIIDVDSHLFELDDFLDVVASPEELAILPSISEQSELPVDLAAIEKGRELLAGRNADPEKMAKFEASMFDITRSPWSRLGAFDPADRSRALDVLGFEKQMILNTYAFHQIGHSDDEQVREVGARVMNRALGRFCEADDRMLGMGYVPMTLGPDKALALLDEALADGCYSVMVDTNEPNPDKPSFTHPDFDPFWARFAERDIPFGIHIAVNGEYDPVAPSFKNNGRGDVAVGGDAPDSILGLVAMANSAQLFLSAMILDEVFERHDGLRVICMEHGASWLPGWLEHINFVERTIRRHQPRDRRAVEVARERIRVAPFANENIGWLMNAGVADMLVFASDYPHPEGSNDPIGRFEATMPDADEDALAAFYAGNVDAFLGAS